MEKLEWSALEYEETNRSTDWFWALGIIVVTSSIASAIFGNYFFAVLLVLGGALLGYFAVKKPEMVSYELNKRGLKVRNRLYLYDNMQSFWVQTNKAHEAGLPAQPFLKPTLFIKTERVYIPVISIPIPQELAESIHSIQTSKNIPEEEMKEHASHKIMEALGF